MVDHILHMQADLRLSVSPPVWPAGIHTTPWQDSAANALMRAAYARGGGEVEQDAARWLEWFTEFDLTEIP